MPELETNIGVSHAEDKDICDSLRLEMSDATPKQDAKVHAMVNAVVNKFYELYKTDIPSDKFIDPGEIAQRIILANREMFELFHKLWSNDKKDADDLVVEDWVAATIFDIGKIMLLDNSKTGWDLIGNEEKGRAIKIFGDEETAKSVVAYVAVSSIVIHEIAHFFQDDNNPLFFKELGANYYQIKVAKESKYSFYENDLIRLRIEFYKKLISEFGDDVHRVFFGSCDNEDRKKEIYSRITKEKAHELFPEYY